MDNQKEGIVFYPGDPEVERSTEARAGGAKVSGLGQMEAPRRPANVAFEMQHRIDQLKEEIRVIEAVRDQTLSGVLASDPRSLAKVLDAIKWLR